MCVVAALGVPLPAHDAVAAGALPIRACGAAVLTAAVITLLAGVYIRQRLGGYTGDCLGAVQQLSELGFLMTGVAVLGNS
jgi:adenosylcobinamide-GDP ribazoletransferase